MIPRGICSPALPDLALGDRILTAVNLQPSSIQSVGDEGGMPPSVDFPRSRPPLPSPPHLNWGRVPGCRIGISPSPPRSICPRWQGWGCCTASGPAARLPRRCASRGRRAPIWPRSHPPMRKSPSYSCRGGVHTHTTSLQKGYTGTAPTIPSRPTRMKSTMDHEGKMASKWSASTQHLHSTLTRSLANANCTQL